MKLNPNYHTRPALLSSLSKVTLISMALILATGCSPKPKAATQVVAKVNDDEISVHQLNNALAKLPQVAAENLDATRRDIVGKLVNEQLAVQQAELQKLDRSADVMMQVDAARREILTRAYLKQLIAGLPKPSAEEVKAFYDTHPQLFAQRRIYSLQEISIASPHPSLAEMQRLAAGKSMNDIATALKQQNIAFTPAVATRAAEQIPLPVLNELAKLEDGQTSVIELPQSILILRRDTSQAAPATEEIALQRIPQYLMNEQGKVAINERLAELKSQSKIEYMNEFSNSADPAISLAMPVSEKKDTSSSVERGIAGIR